MLQLHFFLYINNYIWIFFGVEISNCCPLKNYQDMNVNIVFRLNFRQESYLSLALISVWLSVYIYTLYTATGIYFIWWYLILAIYLICCSVYKIFVPYHGSYARTINTIPRESFGTEQCKDRRIRKKASRNSKTHRQELVVVVFIQMLFISCLLVINVRYYMPVFLVNKMSFLKKKRCLFW